MGEGIVTTIGSAQTYKDVLENPDNISKTVLAKGLDAGTAFEILSIDIADVDVGSNVGAKSPSRHVAGPSITERIERLSPLKRAVVWKEILDPPQSP